MTLFIVPWPCAGTGTACAKARKSRSTIRLDVSTLPAATAAGGRALTRQPSGAAHGDRHERTGRCGHVRIGQRADDEQARRRGHRQRAVEVAVVLRRRAGEVELELLTGDRDGHAQLQLAVRRLQPLGGLVAAVRKRRDPGADAALRVRDELVHRRNHLVAAAARTQLRDPARAEALRRELRAQVAAPLVRVPHPRDERFQRRLVEQRRRDHDALLLRACASRRACSRASRRPRRRGAPAWRRSRAPCARRA